MDIFACLLSDVPEPSSPSGDVPEPISEVVAAVVVGAGVVATAESKVIFSKSVLTMLVLKQGFSNFCKLGPPKAG